LVVADQAKGLPVLRALSLCTCCRDYPGTATGGTASLIRPVMSAFPERVVGSACASSFSRLTQRSLALRPAHSRCHLFVARFTRRLQPFRYLHDCSGCFRLERLPGGPCTHWKAPPCHGAHPKRKSMARARWPQSRRTGGAARRVLVALHRRPLKRAVPMRQRRQVAPATAQTPPRGESSMCQRGR